MHFSAHPREGADPNWKPAQKPEASAASPEEKPEKVSSAPMAPKYMSLTPEKPKTPEPKPEKPIAYDDGGATNAAATKKPEPVATPEPTPELPKTQPKSEPQSTSGKSWSDVRAAAGYSARQSVTSDPALLDLYNKYKEGKMNENFEQFIKKKYR
jgi:hypothetical protein